MENLEHELKRLSREVIEISDGLTEEERQDLFCAVISAFRRHSDNVEKATAKKIFQWMYDAEKEGFIPNERCIRFIAKHDYGVEVDE